MPTPKPNKHELRTKQTRELLLRSAETIFVRDGYERAELGEIAAMAGRTKGAIYAQFKSKEDIFLALIEERTHQYRSHMEKVLATSTSVEENLRLLRQLYLSMIEDPAWLLLQLEVKLFTIRHPESGERFRKYSEEVFPANHNQRLNDLLGTVGSSKGEVNRYVAIKVLQPLFSALAVEAGFTPALLDKEMLKTIAARIFDTLVPAPTH